MPGECCVRTKWEYTLVVIEKLIMSTAMLASLWAVLELSAKKLIIPFFAGGPLKSHKGSLGGPL